MDIAIRFMDHVGIPMEIGFLFVGILANLIPGLPRKMARIITIVCLVMTVGTYAYNVTTSHNTPARTSVPEQGVSQVSQVSATLPALGTAKANENTPSLVQDYNKLNQEKSKLVQENASLLRENARLEKEISTLKTGWNNASEVLECFFYSGEKLEDYYLNAQKVLKAKADSGYPEAQFYLGYMLDPKHTRIKDLCGKLKQNAKEAKRYYKMAADNGHVMSLSFLGNVYYDERDYTHAAECYKKVADKGDGEAQYTLGYMYGKGLVKTAIDTSHYTDKFKEGFKYGVAGN